MVSHPIAQIGNLALVAEKILVTCVRKAHVLWADDDANNARL